MHTLTAHTTVTRFEDGYDGQRAVVHVLGSSDGKTRTLPTLSIVLRTPNHFHSRSDAGVPED